MAMGVHAVNPSGLSGRLRDARVARGLSQHAVAEIVGVPRTAITQIEAGNRSVSTLELAKMASCYRCPVEYFLSAAREDEDILVALHRVAPGLEAENEVRDQVDRCVALCREGVTLESLLGWDRRSGPPSRDLRSPRSTGEAITQAERIADEERLRLNIGFAPLADISELISSQGIWASGVDLPGHMSGLFLRHPSIGMAILVNASHPHVRKRFSFVHEYAHALFDRDRTISVSSTDNSKDQVEKRANAFAAAFLMPRNGVREVLQQLDKESRGRPGNLIYDAASDGSVEVEFRSSSNFQRVTYKDVAVVAQRFGVSYQASVFRLRSLRHISQVECDDLLEREELGREYLRVLGLREQDDEAMRVTERRTRYRELRSEVTSLAIEAYRREEISRGRLLELSGLLGTDGRELLELGETLRLQ